MILVVDDDHQVRNALLRLLRSQGYLAEGAECGATALKIMRQRQPALVLLDYHMPDLTGIDVLRATREDPDLAGIRVVMLSGVDDPHRVAEARQLGALDWIDKRAARLPIERWVKPQNAT